MEEAEQFRFDTLCFLEENVDAQGEKGFGEIDRLQCVDGQEELRNEVRYLFALVGDGQACQTQISSLSDRLDEG